MLPCPWLVCKGAFANASQSRARCKAWGKMMCVKLEFLAEGSRDYPLIRLYEFTREEVCKLRGVFNSLASGTVRNVSLEKEPFIEPIGACWLALSVGRNDLGISRRGATAFECELTELAWENMVGLTDPLRDSEAKGYQWLTSAGRISLLLSHDGKW